MKTALTIAGFDPSSGAGVTADLMVFAAHGVFGTACITSLTVQSTLGVAASHPVEPEIVAATLAHLAADYRPAGIKIGMTSSSYNILAISRYISTLIVLDDIHENVRRIPVVLDPVIRSSSGRELLGAAGIEALRGHLLPLVDWVTPNLDELGVLAGFGISRKDQVAEACRTLQMRVLSESGKPLGILATGGHLPEPDDYLLVPDGSGHWLAGSRVETISTHGTGCALSSAFLCGLINGLEPFEAATSAKKYVAGALASAPEVGMGAGPLNHLWSLYHLIRGAYII
jgi:hydroxymethylpyrimidine/phosphomethylpyrimidine kinase